MFKAMKHAVSASVRTLAICLMVVPAAQAASGGSVVDPASEVRQDAESGMKTSSEVISMSPERMDDVIRAWILAHPEVILQSLSAVQSQNAATAGSLAAEKPAQAWDVLPMPQVTDASDLAAPAAVATSSEAGFTAEEEDLLESMPVVGNPEGDVTVLQFFDYQCRYCKATFPEVVKAMNADGNVRMVMMEWPILGPTSLYAAQAALAAHRQGPDIYVYFHNNLMAEPDTLTREKVDALATKVGLDLVRLKRDMEDPEIEQRILLVHRVAQKLEIRGTPTFLIGRDLLTGGQTQADFVAAVAAVRSNGGT